MPDLQVKETSVSVGKGALTGAIMGLSQSIFGGLVGPLVGAVVGGMVNKKQRDTIALIAGYNIGMNLMGGDSGEESGIGGRVV